MKTLIIIAVILILTGMAQAQWMTPYQNQNLWNQQQYLRNQRQMMDMMRQQQMFQIGQDAQRQMQMRQQQQYNAIQAGMNAFSQIPPRPYYRPPAQCFINAL